MAELDLDFDADNQRRHLRCTIYEPVKVLKDDEKYEGVAVDMSIGGAAIKIDVLLDTQIEVGDPISIFIQGIGRIPATVARIIPGGIAVELRVNPTEEKHLAAELMRILNDIPMEEV